MLQKYLFAIVGMVLAIGTLATAMPAVTALPARGLAEQAPISSPVSTVYAVPDASEVFRYSVDKQPRAIDDLSFS